MSYFKHLDTYIGLLDSFINYRISAVDFDDKYNRLWKCDRDEGSLALKDHISDPNHPLLVKLRDNKITPEEFSNLSGMLLGMSESQARIRSVLDRIFTTCDCFWPDIPDDESDPPLVLSERQFRAEILDLYQELKTLTNKLD